MDADDPERVILHIVVVGFHHQRGSEVEFSFPPLLKHGNSPTTLPSEWRFLPFLALPDGAHNCEQDTTVFHLPSLSTAAVSKQNLQSTIFGISCYKQMDTKDLKIKKEDVTRSTVQKSVCILSSLPLYGYLKEKLKVATRVYFDEKDFSRTGILEELYKNLNMTISPSVVLEDSLLFVGLSVIELVTKFRHKILVLFKLLLLEKKVIFHGFPVGSLCTQLLSLVSLFPKMIQSGLIYAAPRENEIYQEDTFDNHDVFHPLHVHECEQLLVDIFGLPLAMFTKNSIFHPYLSLQQMELLKSPHVRSFVVGASNFLYKRQKGLSEVLVDLESGTIEIHNPELNEQLSLSTADLRFADYLIHHVNDYVEKGEQEAGWDGSDEWIRAQFKLYILSLLSTIQHTDGDGMANYNEHFIEAWKLTTNYQVWRGKEHAGIDDVHAGHPFQGQMGLSDIKIRLSNVMQTERGRRIGNAVAETGKAVGGAINSARSFVTSWLSELTQSTSEQDDGKTKDNEQMDEENIATNNEANNDEL
ncbi:late secretory pathway protein avl9 [Desmophyllum pertusum]|uniref:Late secretory pathway protein avl9 n=1 Tax=Desmophyllum pertusum TaxID=174260 RepID=A0A9X0CNF8_9CNID|nr:late secretory pathway protein avl9 [Desmophyllum pertusum]